MKKTKSMAKAYGKAMKIISQKEADIFFKKMIDGLCKEFPEQSRDEHERIQRSNLAYFAGYYNEEIRWRVEALFKCAHPIFGPVAKYPAPTPDEAFRIGAAMAKAMSEGKSISKLCAKKPGAFRQQAKKLFP